MDDFLEQIFPELPAHFYLYVTATGHSRQCGRERLCHAGGENASEHFGKGQSKKTAPWGFINTASNGGILFIQGLRKTFFYPQIFANTGTVRQCGVFANLFKNSCGLAQISGFLLSFA